MLQVRLTRDRGSNGGPPADDEHVTVVVKHLDAGSHGGTSTDLSNPSKGQHVTSYVSGCKCSYESGDNFYKVFRPDIILI